jgi:HK97 family phage major capsid protein
MTIKELLEKRAKCIADARAIHNKAETEKREPTAEERTQFDALMKEAGELKAKADTMQADEKRTADLAAAEAELTQSRGTQTDPQRANNAAGTTGQEPRTVQLRQSVCGDVRNIVLVGPRADQNFANSFRNYLIHGDRAPGIQNALQKDSDTGGGYLSAPLQFMAELIQAVDNLVFMRQICRVLPPITTAESIGAPSLDADPADPTWTAELAIGNEDSSMSFGKRELKPVPLAQFIKVSKTLLRRSSIGVDAIVRDRLAYKMGVVMENAYLNGTGAGQPLGIFTANANGIPTSRDVSTGNTATEIRFDGLKEAEYSLKAAYRRLANWIFHRDAIKQISKLKDGEGRYIWQPSVQVGQPDRLLNMPIQESEYAPNTFTTGCYVGCLGDFRYYWIVDALTMTIQVLLELYAATNQNGYISRAESDGMPILGEAFSRVKLG